MANYACKDSKLYLIYSRENARRDFRSSIAIDID